MPEDVRPARRVPRLRRGGRRHRPVHRHSAATGSRCGRTREEVVVEFARRRLDRRADRRRPGTARLAPALAAVRHRLRGARASTERGRSTSTRSSRSTCTRTPSARPRRAAGPGHRRGPRRGREVLRRRTRRSRPRRRSPTTTASARWPRSSSPSTTRRGWAATRLGNDEVLEAARGQPRRADPVRERSTRTRASSACARRGELIEARRPRLQVPPQHAGVLAQRPRVLPAVRGDRRGRADRALPHRPDRHRRRHARRRRRPAEVLQPDVRRRRRRRLPRAGHHPRPPVVPVAGRGAGGRDAQAERLHRPLRLVAEVLPGDPRALHEHAAASTRCCSAPTTR